MFSINFWGCTQPVFWGKCVVKSECITQCSHTSQDSEWQCLKNGSPVSDLQISFAAPSLSVFAFCCCSSRRCRLDVDCWQPDWFKLSWLKLQTERREEKRGGEDGRRGGQRRGEGRKGEESQRGKKHLPVSLIGDCARCPAATDAASCTAERREDKERKGSERG